MSRFLPLVIFVLWLASPVAPPPAWESQRYAHDLWYGLIIFLSVYFLLVGFMGLWSRRMARHIPSGDIQQRLSKFNYTMYAARLLIPAWFGAGIFALGYKMLVMGTLSHIPLLQSSVELPALLIGSLPAFLAWMGLWWAQYPADYALRQQNVLIQLNDNLPVYSPPSFWVYFSVNFRLQILFSVAPVLVLLLLRDIMGIALPPVFRQIPWLRDQQTIIEALISIPSAAFIFIYGPEILRRVLVTESMPDSALRRRLEGVCRHHNVRFRDILVWHTRHQMGNAAVMGFVPRHRYFLMSDLLLESMTDEQIGAVFAHEIGHIMHRHLFWLMACVAGLMLAISGPGELIAERLDTLRHYGWMPETLQLVLLIGAALGLFALAFGYISRKFERQADVFAARTLQAAHDAAVCQSELAATGTTGAVTLQVFPRIAEASLNASRPHSYVGRHGAQVFCSALERIAAVNNIPVAARSWCHGSISRRMGFLMKLGRDPAHTPNFDRKMSRLYLLLILALCVFGTWTMTSMWRDGAFSTAPDRASASTAQMP